MKVPQAIPLFLFFLLTNKFRKPTICWHLTDGLVHSSFLVNANCSLRSCKGELGHHFVFTCWLFLPWHWTLMPIGILDYEAYERSVLWSRNCTSKCEAQAERVTEASDSGRDRCELKRPCLPKQGRHCPLSSPRRLSIKMPAQGGTSASPHYPPPHQRAKGNPAFYLTCSYFCLNYITKTMPTAWPLTITVTTEIWLQGPRHSTEGRLGT